MLITTYKTEDIVDPKETLSKNIRNTNNDYDNYIKELVESNNCMFVSIEIKNKRKYISFECNIHLGYYQKKRLDSIAKYGCCKQCNIQKRNKSLSGENNPNWKGGTTEFNHLSRNILSTWKRDVLQKNNFQCELTGSTENLEVHHLYGFNLIILEIIKEIGINIKNLDDLSVEQKNIIIDKIINYHYENMGIGVVLNSDIHKNFHDIYGKGNNTPAQFEEFKKEYANFKNKNSRYIPKKRTSTSKYFGVSRKGSKWASHITFNSNQMYLGTFENEYLAAKAYNDKSIELFGKYAKLNKLDESDNIVNEFANKFYKFKKCGTSQYTGIYFHEGKWETEILKGGKRIFRGRYDNELEAVYFYNKNKLELLGEDSMINYLSEDEIGWVERLLEENKHNREIEYYEHKNNSKSIYTNVGFSKGKWDSRFRLNGEIVHIGRYDTDKDAAIAYNNYVIRNNLNKKLNKII